MKTLDATWLAEAQRLYGQDVVATFELELAGGTEYLSTRTITVGANTYNPLLLDVGPITSSLRPLSPALIGTTCPLVVDNRVRFGGPSTRFATKLTGTEPEGVRYSLSLVMASDTTKAQVIHAGRVLSVDIQGDVVSMVLADDLAFLDQSIGTSTAIGVYDCPRNVVWDDLQVSDVGKAIPVRYGDRLDDQEGVWVRQCVDRLRLFIAVGATEIPVHRPEIWNPAGGTGWISVRASGPTLERFLYTGVDLDSRKLTGVTRNHLNAGNNAYDPTNEVAVIPSLDNDFDPENIDYLGEVGLNVASGATKIRKVGLCHVKWSNQDATVTTIRVNGQSSPQKIVLDDDGMLRLFQYYGLIYTASWHVNAILEYMWYSDVNDRDQVNLFDFDDGTHVQFGDLASAGQWSAVGVGVNHDSGVAGEMEAPYDTTWDDKIEGRFRLSASKTESVARNPFWIVDHPGTFGIEIKYRVVTAGTKTVDNCEIHIHGTSITTLAAEADDDDEHWKQRHIIPIATDPTGTIITKVLNQTLIPLSRSFGGSVSASPWIDWLFGIEYSGAGTDWVVDFISIRRIWCRGIPPPVSVTMDNTGNDVALANVVGVKDDGAGTYTGSANALIENPADVRRHYIETVGGVPVANIDLPSFTGERSKYDAGTAPLPSPDYFRGVADSPRDFGQILAEMDFAAQAFTYCSEGKVRSHFRETVATLVAAGSDRDLVQADVASLGGLSMGDADLIGRPGTRTRLVDVDRPPAPRIVRQRIEGLVLRSQPINAHRISADEIGNQSGSEFNPVNDPTLAISGAVLVGATQGMLQVRAGRTALGSAPSAASATSFGARRAEVLPDTPWLNFLSTANIRVANINKWREDPRLIVEILAYLEQFELDVGDLLTIEWTDYETGHLHPQFDGVKKFLVLPTPLVLFPGEEIAKVAMTVIQVDL